MGTGVPPNTIYYGYIDGVLSQMAYIQMRGEAPLPVTYMMAVPSSATDPRSRRARVLQDQLSADGPEKEIYIRIVALTGLNGMKKKPLPSWTAAGITKFETGMPRLDDLEKICREKTALPVMPNNMQWWVADVQFSNNLVRDA